MLEMVKLNTKLLKTQFNVFRFKLCEKEITLNYLLTTQYYIFVILAMTASAFTILDATTTVVILSNGGAELNPITLYLYNNNLNDFLQQYYNGQVIIANVIAYGALTYVLALFTAIVFNLRELEKTKMQNLIRNLSGIMKWAFAFVLVIRLYCVVWNMYIIYSMG